PGGGVSLFVQGGGGGRADTRTVHRGTIVWLEPVSCELRALDALPSGSSSLARGSETTARKAPLVRRIPASQANRPWGFPHSAFVPRETSCKRSGPLLDFRSRGSVARIIAIANQKGGVGKTTTAVNLSACLATAKQPTLLVDCDSQANTTAAIGFEIGRASW